MKNKKSKKKPFVKFLKALFLILYLTLVVAQIMLIIQSYVHKDDVYTFGLFGLSGISIKKSTNGDAKQGDLYITSKAGSPEELLLEIPVVFQSNNTVMAGKISRVNANRITLTSGEDIYTVDFENTFGNVKTRLKYFGFAADFLTSIIGIVTVLVVPGVLIAIFSFVHKRSDNDDDEFIYNPGTSELPLTIPSGDTPYAATEKKPFDKAEIHQMFVEQAALRGGMDQAQQIPYQTPQNTDAQSAQPPLMPAPKAKPEDRPIPAAPSALLTAAPEPAAKPTAPPMPTPRPIVPPVTPVPLVTPIVQPKVIPPEAAASAVADAAFTYNLPKRETPFVDENKTILFENTDSIPVTPLHQDNEEYFDDPLNKIDDTQPLTITTNKDGVPQLSPADEESDELSPVPDRITIPKTTFVTPKPLTPSIPKKPGEASFEDVKPTKTKDKSIEFVIDTAQTSTVWLKMKTDGSGVEIVTDNYTANFDTLNE